MTDPSERALTIWQPWASLIIAGAKPFEFRTYPAWAPMIGRRIVIHAAARIMRRDEVAELLDRIETGTDVAALDATIAQPLLRTWLAELSKGMRCNMDLPPHGFGLGTALLGEPIHCASDPARFGAEIERINPDIWAWPLTNIRPFNTPIAARGAQGFWKWSPVPQLFGDER